MKKPDTTRPAPAACATCSTYWSARRLKEAGADCVKILLYYTPYDPKDVNDKKHAWVERIGDECRANDIPYFLEFVGYEEGADEKGLEYAKKKPHIVTESMREFSKDRYGVDVLKVEVPVNMKFVEGTKCFGGHEGLHEERSHRPVPQSRQRRDQAVHLSVGGRQQCGVQRDAGTGRRIRREVQRRALRPRDLERRHPGLREAGCSRLPQVARNRRREEHQQRQRQAESRYDQWHSIYGVELVHA